MLRSDKIELLVYNNGEWCKTSSEEVDLSDYQLKVDEALQTGNKTIVGAINEVRASVEDIHAPYQIDIQALLSASDSESISAAIGTIQALNNVVSENRAIVGSVASGTVGVSIRILGNVTSLYYILDTVLGYTVNEINITDNSGVLSKQVVTHAFITENRVVNSLDSDETTLPLSAAQGKALNESKQAKEDSSLTTDNKTIIGAINEVKSAVDSKTTGVGKVDSNSDGTGEIFNCYVDDDSFTANQATGRFAHAEGENNVASDYYCHVEGTQNVASNIAAHAEGQGCKAAGGSSHAEGLYCTTQNQGEHAEGQYNLSHYNFELKYLQTRHSVGIGSSDPDRKNAHEIMVNGDHYVYGIGGYDGTEIKSNTNGIKTLQDVITDLQNRIAALEQSSQNGN